MTPARAICTISCCGRRYHILKYMGGFISIESCYVRNGFIGVDLPPEMTMWHADIRDTITATLMKAKFNKYLQDGWDFDYAAIRAIREVDSSEENK